MKIYLVGGAVRDELLGRHNQDRDFVVIGATEEAFFKQFPRAKKVGSDECVYIHDGAEYTLSPFPSIEADLDSRDLTINAVAKDPDGMLVAHPQAFADIDRKVLRPISAENFVADPLRVFRVARFVAEFPDFERHHTITDIIRMVASKNLLGRLAAERVGKELLKACSAPAPDLFFSVLTSGAALVPWFAELSGADQIPAGPAPYHSGSVLEHTLEVASALAGNPLTVWMGVCHDIGKTATDREAWPHHHKHESNGAVMATNIGSRLRLPGRFIEAGELAARWHMAAGKYDQLRISTKVKLLVLLHRTDLLRELFELVIADNGPDFTEQAAEDLTVVLDVHLPPKHQGLGNKSGELLHQLRCQRLQAHYRERGS